jgi:hypothetical protein
MYPHDMHYLRRWYNYKTISVRSAMLSAMFASFFAGIFCQKLWDNSHPVNFDVGFNTIMLIAWLVLAIVFHFVSVSRARSSESAKKVDS